MVAPSRQISLSLVMGAGALLLYALLLPLGLARVGTASFSANAALLGGSLDPLVAAPISILLGAFATFIPLGHLAARAHMASAFPAAIAVGLMVSYLLRLAELLRARQDSRLLPIDLAHEPIACVGAATVVALSPSLAAAGTQAGPLAVTALMVIGGLILTSRAMALPSDSRLGLSVVLLCGLAAGADPIATAVLWPPALLLWLRSLRQGERWPLIAPFVFMIGACVLVFLVAVVAEPRAEMLVFIERLGQKTLRAALVDATGARAWAVLARVVDEVGVVAILLAIVGLTRMVLRTPAHAGLIIYALWAVVLVGGRVDVTDPRSGVAVGLFEFLLAPAIAAGILQVAGQMGRGRAAAALAIAVISAVNPAISLTQEQDSISIEQGR